MSNQIEQIRAEIERRKKVNLEEGETGWTCVDEDDEILHFIDQLPAQLVTAEEGKILPKLREFLATATPEELEAKYRELEYLLAPKDEDAYKAAEKYADEQLLVNNRELAESGHTRHFKMGYVCFAGYEIEEAYAAGMLAERERLMKEAVEIAVSNVGILQMGSILTDRGISAGGTIKLIILK